MSHSAVIANRFEFVDKTCATEHLTRRLLITSPGTISIVEREFPALKENEVFIRTIVSGISHGTELAWLRGTAPALHRSWDANRRFYTDGPGKSFPIAPGYESVGRVVEVGSTVSTVRVGDMIAVDAPHADGHLVSESNAAAGLLPKDTDPEQAIFFILARVALGGVHDASISLGDRVVIFGLGAVGLLTAQMAKLAGATVVGVDRYSLRTETAKGLGIETILSQPDVDVAAMVRDLTGTSGADVAIEASGSYLGLHEAIRCLRVGGRAVTVASYHGDQYGLRLGEDYHRNRITLISSMTANQCPQREGPAWTFDRLTNVARHLIASRLIQTESFLTHRFDFTRAAEAYSLITNSPQNTIKVALTYGD